MVGKRVIGKKGASRDGGVGDDDDQDEGRPSDDEDDAGDGGGGGSNYLLPSLPCHSALPLWEHVRQTLS